MTAPPPPRIFSYLGYREFCGAWWAWRRSVDPDYSHARFAEASGLARSAFHNVLHGNRVPRPATLDGIARGMGLTPTERNYLGLLVDLERAGSLAARSEVIARIMARQAFGLAVQLDDKPDAWDEFGTRWYAPAILELARLPGFRPDAVWLSKTIVPPIEVEQAQAALDLLRDLGLLAPAADGTAAPSARRVETSADSPARASFRFHHDGLPELLRRLAEVPPADRHLQAGIVFLPAALVPEVKQRVDAVVKQISDLGDDDPEPGTPRRAYILALQLMPVSVPTGPDGALPPTDPTLLE